MTVNRTAYKLIWCSLLLTATAAFGQAIDVVVLNGKNGHAIRNAEVWVQFYEAPTSRKHNRIEYKTGPDGVAHIQLPAPPPAHLTLSASANPFYPGYENVATADIVSQGAVSQCDPKASRSTRTPVPGEVAFFLCRVPWWVRVLAPLVRG
jgi:hypothetical protein